MKNYVIFHTQESFFFGKHPCKLYLNSLVGVRKDSNHHINEKNQGAYDKYSVQNPRQRIGWRFMANGVEGVQFCYSKKRPDEVNHDFPPTTKKAHFKRKLTIAQ